MPPEMFYEFTKERGSNLKAMLLNKDAQVLKRIEEADADVAERILENVSRGATQKAKASVGYFEYEQSKREDK